MSETQESIKMSFTGETYYPFPPKEEFTLEGLEKIVSQALEYARRLESKEQLNLTPVLYYLYKANRCIGNQAPVV